MDHPRTDADIQRDVVESLYWDTRIDAAHVGVIVDDRRVTLVGSVPTYRARAAAREDALVIRDVAGVDNRLEVEISAQLDTPDDKELQSTVEEVLGADPDLRAADIEVEVHEGRVRLLGHVLTYGDPRRHRGHGRAGHLHRPGAGRERAPAGAGRRPSRTGRPGDRRPAPRGGRRRSPLVRVARPSAPGPVSWPSRGRRRRP